MKKTIVFSVILFLLFLTACEVLDINNNKSQEEDLKELIAHKEYILSLVATASCTSNSQCEYVALGSKPCGGPWSYLVYPSSMDTRILLEQVTIYNLKEHQYNQKWGVFSDCMLVAPPTRVDCVNNKCVAVYNN
ncbi:MAG: hypothetical protein Q7U08_06115 [Flavobacteriaceae bacterium]|jgi:hypothetical protein|nr:hypothetical protein [Flavobacteriaceae bacterium]